jgi:hypothetical protein
MNQTNDQMGIPNDSDQRQTALTIGGLHSFETTSDQAKLLFPLLAGKAAFGYLAS